MTLCQGLFIYYVIQWVIKSSRWQGPSISHQSICCQISAMSVVPSSRVSQRSVHGLNKFQLMPTLVSDGGRWRWRGRELEIWTRLCRRWPPPHHGDGRLLRHHQQRSLSPHMTISCDQHWTSRQISLPQPSLLWVLGRGGRAPPRQRPLRQKPFNSTRCRGDLQVSATLKIWIQGLSAESVLDWEK